MEAITAGLALLTVFCVAVLAAGLNWTLPRTAIAASRQHLIGFGVPAAIGTWLGLTAMLAHYGVLSEWKAFPPTLPALPLFAFTCGMVVQRRPWFREVLAVIPPVWVVAFQTFRIGVEFAFWGIYAVGAAPRQVTFEGRNFDVLVGLTAPLVALAMARFNMGSRAIIAWNLFGLAVLANTIFTVITSVPGPQHLDWPGEPFTALAQWPIVWIPAFLAPLAIFLHVSSIRQAGAAAAR